MVRGDHDVDGVFAPERVPRWLPVVAWSCFGALLIVMLARAGLFGHDEAQYAIGARGWITGDPDDVYPLHRSIGMLGLAAPGALAGGNELVTRLPFVGIAIVFVLLAWRFSRRWFGAVAGALVLVIITSASPWCWRAIEVLSDIPAALCLLAAVTLVVADGEAAQPRAWRWACIGALLAIAIVIRYGALSSVAATGLAALVAYPRRWRWLMLAAAVSLVVLVPVLVWSASVTGSPIGIWREGARMGVRSYIGEGLVHYVTRWPTTLAGPVAGIAAAIGVVVGVRAWRRGAATTAAGRIRRLLVVAALSHLIATGLAFHGESRFMFFPITALVMIGCSWIAERPAPIIRVAVAICLVAIIPAGIWSYLRVAMVADQRRAFPAATAAVRADAGTERCVLFAGTAPQLGWYTGCRAEYIDEWTPPNPAVARDYPHVYLVVIEGMPRQPADVAKLSTPSLTWRELTRGTGWRVYAAR